jgi:hypothetical protein
MELPLSSLRTTSEEHHALLVPHVDKLLTLAVPHMEAIEHALYDRLEQVMGGRHSMSPMREEHRAVGHLVEELGRYRRHVDGCTWSAIEGMALRRALYRLHALLKVHLAEEELYLGVLDRNLTDEEKDLLARSLDHAQRQPL